MSLLSRPFDAITAADVDDLIARQIREGPTLDYKRTLDFSDSGKLDILGDVTAMANAAGGTLLYGAVEGDGEDAGVIVGIAPVALPPDETERRYLQLLRDNVDERIPGVLCRALPVDGGSVYVVRIPASPLAPHMVTLKSQRPRFFLRGNVLNEPMTARQIKEIAARADAAYDRAAGLIAERTALIQQRDAKRREYAASHGGVTPGGIRLVHAVSLVPSRGGIDFVDDALHQRFAVIPQVGVGDATYDFTVRVALEGLYNETGRANVSAAGGPGASTPQRYSLLLRAGGLECVEYELLFNPQAFGMPERRVYAWDVEQSLIDTVAAAQTLAEAGVLALPIALSLQLLGVDGADLTAEVSNRGGLPSRPERDVVLDPAVITSWGPDADAVVRRLCDAVWQAWGVRRSPHFGADGARVPRR